MINQKTETINKQNQIKKRMALALRANLIRRKKMIDSNSNSMTSVNKNKINDVETNMYTNVNTNDEDVRINNNCHKDMK